MRNIFILGASGHGKSILDIVKAEKKYEIIGFIDSQKDVGSDYCGFPILGRESDLNFLIQHYQVNDLIIAIGSNYHRFAAAERIQKSYPTIQLATSIHPSAVIASDVEIGSGTVIMPHATIITGAKIGQGCILNTASSLDHDSVMEDWSSIAPGVTTGGNVKIKMRSSVGLGSNLIHKVEIGQDTVIGAGSLILKNIPERVVAYGNPCEIVRERSIDEKYL
ncbi:acetyltransferase [Nodularia spumigena CS-591/12]|uniref:acetyltransferase n=1 Tax=Nodularia spumigena TaxID=70799 RepID=UPI00232D3638|nr:acetyltransferase [Nodularia spumigena]MDB9304553.1 acetyltransferase [Nodularia spumigena CS-591/12]